VAVIGTGATAVQAITEIAKTVGHLTVFQRTPNWCAPLHNSKIDAATQARIKATYGEIFAVCRESFGCFIHQADPRNALEVSPEEREAFFEKLYREPGFGIWMGNFRDVLIDQEANATITEFMRRKIRARVKDPAVAEKLIPTNHGFGTRRVPLESGYYEVYNQGNVRLVDIRETPIERITPAGVKTSEAEHTVDMIIYATGFDAITGAFDRIDIRGRGWPATSGEVGGRPAYLPGAAERGLPELVHAGGAAQRGHLLQYPALYRAERGLGDRAHRVHARPGPHSSGADAGSGARLGPARARHRPPHALHPGRLVDDGHQLQRGGQAEAHLHRLRGRGAEVPREVRRGRRRGLCRVCVPIVSEDFTFLIWPDAGPSAKSLIRNSSWQWHEISLPFTIRTIDTCRSR
jgi:cation diffusion facilitator CzcD-associated flavoprotein CzcO